MDLIIHIGWVDQVRRITSVIELTGGLEADGRLIAYNTVFKPAADGRAVPNPGRIQASTMDRLVAAGFDPRLMEKPRRMVGDMTATLIVILIGARAGCGGVAGVGVVSGRHRAARPSPVGAATVRPDRATLLLVGAAVAGLFVGSLSGWPVAGIATAVLVRGVPDAVGRQGRSASGRSPGRRPLRRGQR